MKFICLILFAALLLSGCAKTKCVSSAMVYETKMNLYGQYYVTQNYVCMKYETYYGL